MTRRIPTTLFAAMFALLIATPAHAQMTASELMTRLDQIEAQLRSLTGTVEQLQYRNNQLEQQLRTMQEGARPATARTAPPPLPPLQQAQPAPQIAQPLPQPTPPAPAPAQRRSDAFDPNENPNAPGTPLDLSTLSAQASQEQPAPAPRPAEIRNIPGVLPPPSPRNPNATGNTQVVMAPTQTQTPKDEYDLAYGYMQRKDYALAEQALRGFLAKYPSDHQVGDATYWLGESMFQRQRYRESAEVFLSVSTKFGTSAKAPEAMLRLGQSLAALKDKETACAALGEIARKYPKASVSIKSAEREQKRIGC